MDYVLNRTNNILDKAPGAVIVCGGDLNQPNINKSEELLGWGAMVDFPAGGNAYLDSGSLNK